MLYFSSGLAFSSELIKVSIKVSMSFFKHLAEYLPPLFISMYLGGGDLFVLTFKNIK